MPPCRWCDGALRVLSAGRSRRQRVQRARKNLQVAVARILGSGLNCLDASFDTQAYLPGYYARHPPTKLSSATADR